MAGSRVSVKQDGAESMAMSAIVYQLEVQYGRFIVFPPPPAVGPHPLPVPQTNAQRKMKRSGAWISTFPTIARAASLKIIAGSSSDYAHGTVLVSLKFMDTPQFQRLRDLKQLGLTYMVYPGAVHSRFEHSLGEYWLANEAISRLNKYQGRELAIDHVDIQTVKLAGLLHDGGHGTFSHMLKKEFISRVLHGCKWSHEEMSLKMIDYDKHNIDLNSHIVKKPKVSEEKRFLCDIVANGRNSIDVDKFDCIISDSRACGLGCNFDYSRILDVMRVIDNEICYRAKEYLTIHKLFSTRADLHRTVYMHSKAKATELMVVDAMVKANYDKLKFASDIENPADYWKLDDTLVKTIETKADPELKESRGLICCQKFTPRLSTADQDAGLGSKLYMPPVLLDPVIRSYPGGKGGRHDDPRPIAVVVESDTGDWWRACLILHMAGFDIRPCRSGFEALTFFGESVPPEHRVGPAPPAVSVVIINYVLVGALTGIELVRYISSVTRIAVVMTSFDRLNRSECMYYGATAFIKKPLRRAHGLRIKRLIGLA